MLQSLLLLANRVPQHPQCMAALALQQQRGPFRRYGLPWVSGCTVLCPVSTERVFPACSLICVPTLSSECGGAFVRILVQCANFQLQRFVVRCESPPAGFMCTWSPRRNRSLPRRHSTSATAAVTSFRQVNTNTLFRAESVYKKNLRGACCVPHARSSGHPLGTHAHLQVRLRMPVPGYTSHRTAPTGCWPPATWLATKWSGSNSASCLLPSRPGEGYASVWEAAARSMLCETGLRQCLHSAFEPAVAPVLSPHLTLMDTGVACFTGHLRE